MPSFSAASLAMRCIFAFCAMSISDGTMVSSVAFRIVVPNIGTQAGLSLDCGQELPKRCPRLRGRRPVRADRRLRADDGPVRTQSPISYETPAPCLVLIKTAFLVRMVFIRTKNAVGVRSAQWLLVACASTQDNVCSDWPPPKLECTGLGPPFFTFTAQYLNSGILPKGSSTGLVSLFAAAS